MKTTRTVLIGLFILMYSSALLAQEWNAKQKEIWKVVETYNDAWKNGDVAGFMAYFHPNYKGWNIESPVPYDKTTVQKYIDLNSKVRKVEFVNLTPLSIQVFDNFAVVHYLYHDITTTDGKKESSSGRWTDILIKQDGKWMLIADSGGDFPSKNN